MTQEPGRQRRRLIGIGFVIAFVLSTATIIYTGLNVRAPRSHRADDSATEAAGNEAMDSDVAAQREAGIDSDANEPQ
ncbi:MAG: hypothetical protein PVF63_09870 [Gammaproteobacteria bacterium]|jgi:hypothetical protein